MTVRKSIWTHRSFGRGHTQHKCSTFSGRVRASSSSTLTPSSHIHLSGSVKCKGDHYQWKAADVLLSCLPLQRKWEDIANVYSPASVRVWVNVMSPCDAWGLTCMTKQLTGLFSIKKCADFREFCLQIFPAARICGVCVCVGGGHGFIIICKWMFCTSINPEARCCFIPYCFFFLLAAYSWNFFININSWGHSEECSANGSSIFTCQVNYRSASFLSNEL